MEQEISKKHCKTLKDHKLICKIIFETLMVSGMTIILLSHYVLSKSTLPYDRGFYCNDRNLKHPFLPETISKKACLTIWIITGLMVVPSIELSYFMVFEHQISKTDANERCEHICKLADISSFFLGFYRTCCYFLSGF